MMEEIEQIAPITVEVMAPESSGPALILSHEGAARLAKRAELLAQCAWVIARKLTTEHDRDNGRILAEHMSQLADSLSLLAELAVYDAAELAARLAPPPPPAQAKTTRRPRQRKSAA